MQQDLHGSSQSLFEMCDLGMLHKGRCPPTAEHTLASPSGAAVAVSVLSLDGLNVSRQRASILDVQLSCCQLLQTEHLCASVEEAKQLFKGSWPELRVLIVGWDWLLCIEDCPMSSAWHELIPATT